MRIYTEILKNLLFPYFYYLSLGGSALITTFFNPGYLLQDVSQYEEEHSVDDQDHWNDHCRDEARCEHG